MFHAPFEMGVTRGVKGYSLYLGVCIWSSFARCFKRALKSSKEGSVLGFMFSPSSWAIFCGAYIHTHDSLHPHYPAAKLGVLTIIFSFLTFSDRVDGNLRESPTLVMTRATSSSNFAKLGESIGTRFCMTEEPDVTVIWFSWRSWKGSGRLSGGQNLSMFVLGDLNLKVTRQLQKQEGEPWSIWPCDFPSSSKINQCLMSLCKTTMSLVIFAGQTHAMGSIDCFVSFVAVKCIRWQTKIDSLYSATASEKLIVFPIRWGSKFTSRMVSLRSA